MLPSHIHRLQYCRLHVENGPVAQAGRASALHAEGLGFKYGKPSESPDGSTSYSPISHAFESCFRMLAKTSWLMGRVRRKQDQTLRCEMDN